jgi:hypothetical protein
VLGAVLAPSVAPIRRAAVERLLRLRAMLGDPVAPFMDAPCHREPSAGYAEGTVIRETSEPRMKGL